MKNQLESIRQAAKAALEHVSLIQDLEQLRIQYLGKKGELTAILKQMGKLSPEERPLVGQMANETRAYIEGAIESKKAQLAQKSSRSSLRRKKLTLRSQETRLRLAQSIRFLLCSTKLKRSL